MADRVVVSFRQDVRLLGPPSPSFLARGNLTQRFFSQEGNSSILPLFLSLETSLSLLERDVFSHQFPGVQVT
jgi:hypothetical protein